MLNKRQTADAVYLPNLLSTGPKAILETVERCVSVGLSWPLDDRPVAESHCLGRMVLDRPPGKRHQYNVAQLCLARVRILTV
jgi:hypothetical protein